MPEGQVSNGNVWFGKTTKEVDVQATSSRFVFPDWRFPDQPHSQRRFQKPTQGKAFFFVDSRPERPVL